MKPGLKYYPLAHSFYYVEDFLQLKAHKKCRYY